MDSAPQMTARNTLWTARAIAIVAVLFLLFDAIGKFVRPQPVVDAFARLGLSITLAPAIGALLCVLVVLYVIPRTRIIGAILMIGYLGGAIAVQLRAGTSAFETLFPVIMGALIWLPLYLVDRRVRTLFSLQG